MELAGNQEKIQALFRELKLEDQSGAPGFFRVWNGAQATSLRPRHAFKTSFAVATALLVITLCSLALWSRNWGRDQQPIPSVAGGSAMLNSTSALAPALPKPKQLGVAEPRKRVGSNRWTRKLAARRQTELVARNAVISKAVVISSWQSPTATLMQSPADDVLTSLPQLNRSVTELKSILANTLK